MEAFKFNRFNRSNKLEQLEFKLEKLIGIQKTKEKLENDVLRFLSFSVEWS